MDTDAQQKLADLAARSEKERKRFYARRPKRAADVVAAVVAKRGYAASRAAGELDRVWRAAAGKVLGGDALAAQTRVEGLSRGRLDVVVANHVVMQEINFHRPRLLAEAQAAVPSARIASIRFKVGRTH
ncbi:DUF721 domain-containing protein [Botrimarina sp.]|uniref:DUF721 domain-containing protein n=1 Tax=Botrimarina sp. TaxID=2795802 RepID=UPI0032EB018F